MNRAERRRAEREAQKAQKTYTFTQEQLDRIVREKVMEEIEKLNQDAIDKALTTSMILSLTLPLEVLMNHYWKKSYIKRLPPFTELMLEYYRKWENGELDIEELKEHLWEYGGVRLEESE